MEPNEIRHSRFSRPRRTSWLLDTREDGQGFGPGLHRFYITLDIPDINNGRRGTTLKHWNNDKKEYQSLPVLQKKNLLDSQ